MSNPIACLTESDTSDSDSANQNLLPYKSIFSNFDSSNHTLHNSNQTPTSSYKVEQKKHSTLANAEYSDDSMKEFSNDSDGDIEATQLLSMHFKSHLPKKNYFRLNKNPEKDSSNSKLQELLCQSSIPTKDSFSSQNNSILAATQFSNPQLLTKTLFSENLSVKYNKNATNHIGGECEIQYVQIPSKKVDFATENSMIINQTQLDINDIDEIKESTSFISETHLNQKILPDSINNLQFNLNDNKKSSYVINETQLPLEIKDAYSNIINETQFPLEIKNDYSNVINETQNYSTSLESQTSAISNPIHKTPYSNNKFDNGVTFLPSRLSQKTPSLVLSDTAENSTNINSINSTPTNSTQLIDFCSPKSAKANPLSEIEPLEKNTPHHIYDNTESSLALKPKTPIVCSALNPESSLALKSKTPIACSTFNPDFLPSGVVSDFEIEEYEDFSNCQDQPVSCKNNTSENFFFDKDAQDSNRSIKINAISGSDTNASGITPKNLDLFQVKIGAICDTISFPVACKRNQKTFDSQLNGKKKRKLFSFNNKEKITNAQINTFEIPPKSTIESSEILNSLDQSDILLGTSALNSITPKSFTDSNILPETPPTKNKIIINSAKNQTSKDNCGRESAKSAYFLPEAGNWAWQSISANCSNFFPVFIKTCNYNSPFAKNLFIDGSKSSEKKKSSSNSAYYFNDKGRVQTLLAKSSTLLNFKQIKQGDRVWAIKRRKRNAETGSVVSIERLSNLALDVMNGKTNKKALKSEIPHFIIKFDKDLECQKVPIFKVHSTSALLNMVITPQKQHFVKERGNSKDYSLLKLYNLKKRQTNESLFTPSKGATKTDIAINNNISVKGDLLLGLGFLVTFSPLLCKTQSNKDANKLKAGDISGLSQGNIDRQHLESYIISFGGTVFNSPIDFESKYIGDYKNVFILSDSPSATFKYLFGLAFGLPLVSFFWVFECIKRNTILNPLSFVLANGWSYELNTACASPPIKNFMCSYSVMLCGSRTFKDNWQMLLKRVGAKIVVSPNFMTTGTSGQKKRCDFILTEYSTDLIWRSQIMGMYHRGHIETLQEQVTKDDNGETSKQYQSPHFVSSQWAKQCLINQRVLEYDGHASYTTFCKKKSNAMRSLIKTVD
ncbi:hypothetical protein BB561_001654 [Smittium simulii]|uniref:BRCT domain-containing protein n=1 Tax=Smittium simulii TaxID=133385 RepID=A0A2T9YTT4_9FUNG|nr:hypothetical protein BB561_001654 [Smittium simulii]